eukprot:6890731-Prymnesium_polylepis.1
MARPLFAHYLPAPCGQLLYGAGWRSGACAALARAAAARAAPATRAQRCPMDLRHEGADTKG